MRGTIPPPIVATCALIVSVCAVPAAGSERAALLRELGQTLAAAEAATSAGDLDAAAAGYLDALERAPALGARGLLVARASEGLADVHRLAGRLAEAEALYVEAVPLWERLLGAGQPRLAVALHNLGVVRLGLERPAEARPPLERALAIFEAALGPDSTEARSTRRALVACGVPPP